MPSFTSILSNNFSRGALHEPLPQTLSLALTNAHDPRVQLLGPHASWKIMETRGIQTQSWKRHGIQDQSWKVMEFKRLWVAWFHSSYFFQIKLLSSLNKWLLCNIMHQSWVFSKHFPGVTPPDPFNNGTQIYQSLGFLLIQICCCVLKDSIEIGHGKCEWSSLKVMKKSWKLMATQKSWNPELHHWLVC